MIQAVMLVLLGFLSASLLALFAAPAFWKRAVRLTSDRLRRTLPLSELEIQADKDLLRAEYAVRVHRLEKSIEQSKLNAHRQLIELNRRDVTIARLNEDLSRTSGDLETNRNARHVLEQTVDDRIPRIEARLQDARRMVRERDAEIARLAENRKNLAGALAETRAMNDQQQAEIERLQAAVAARQSRDRRRFSELGVDSEASLRAELETLRSRSRDQTAMIHRLQSEVAMAQTSAVSVASGDDAQQASLTGGLERMKSIHDEQAAEIKELRRQLTAAEASMNALADSDGDAVVVTNLQKELHLLRSRAEDQADEIHRLTAELAIAQADDADEIELPSAVGGAGNAKLNLRLQSAEAKSKRDAQTIMRLRSELAAANERAARQAAYFRDEMRHFGNPQMMTGVGQTSGRRAEHTRNGSAASAIARAQQAVAPRQASPDTARAARPEAGSVARVAAAATGQHPEHAVRKAADVVTGEAGQPGSRYGGAGRTSQTTSAPRAEALVAAGTAAERLTKVETEHENRGPDSARRQRLLDRLRSFEDSQ